MSKLGESEIEQQLAQIGHPASFTDSTGVVHESYAALDESDQDVATAEGGTIAARVTVATFKTGVFPGLEAGDTLTIDGTDYRVTQVRLQERDGALTDAWCARKT
jgi:hypothetical protein